MQSKVNAATNDISVSTRAALDTTTLQCSAPRQHAAHCWLLIVTITTNNEPRWDAKWKHCDQHSNSGRQPDSNEAIIENPAAEPHEFLPFGTAEPHGNKHKR
jgi:hypothetical protein